MKKLTCLVIVFVLGTNLINANIVKSGDAKKIAENFYKQFANQDLKAVSLNYTEMSTNGEPVFYVFNVNDGFVVVAADDSVSPIINYVNQGKYNAPKPKGSGNNNVVTIDIWGAKKWATQPSEG